MVKGSGVKAKSVGSPHKVGEVYGKHVARGGVWLRSYMLQENITSVAFTIKLLLMEMEKQMDNNYKVNMNHF